MAYSNNYARVYLTRRNLLTLLNKLDRVKDGDTSACTLIKQDLVHTKYPCTHVTYVTAVEDKDYYADRSAGDVLPIDGPEQHPSSPSRAQDCDCLGCRSRAD
jgi:hypothetical protein